LCGHGFRHALYRAETRIHSRRYLAMGAAQIDDPRSTAKACEVCRRSIRWTTVPRRWLCLDGRWKQDRLWHIRRLFSAGPADLHDIAEWWPAKADPWDEIWLSAGFLTRWSETRICPVQVPSALGRAGFGHAQRHLDRCDGGRAATPTYALARRPSIHPIFLLARWHHARRAAQATRPSL